MKTYTWLNNYHYNEASIKNGKTTPRKGKKKQISIVKKLHDMEPVTGATLLNVFKNPTQHRNEKFLFEGRIVQLHGVEQKSILKILNKNTDEISKFNAKNISKINRVFYHFVL